MNWLSSASDTKVLVDDLQLGLNFVREQDHHVLSYVDRRDVDPINVGKIR